MRGIFLGLILLLIGSVSWAADGNPLEEKAAATNKKNAVQLTQLGELYLEAMQLKKAERTFKKALSRDAKYLDAKLGLIKIRMIKSKRMPKHKCRLLVRDFKKSSVGHICSGVLWLGQRRSSNAKESFNIAVEMGDIERGQLGLGDVALLLSDYAGAKSAFAASAQANENYLAQIGLGKAELLKDKKDEAIVFLKKAVAMEPASCNAHFYLAKATLNETEAISHLKVAIAIRPDWPEALQLLGDLQLAANDNEGAQTTFGKLVMLEEGKTSAAYLGLGRALVRMNDTVGARKALHKATALVGNLLEAYLLLADIEYLAGNSDEAIKALEKASASSTDNAQINLRAGDIFFKVGRYTAANTYLTKAITKDFKISAAHYMLGQIACERRLYEKGRNYFDNALNGDLKGVDVKEIKEKKAACKSKYIKK